MGKAKARTTRRTKSAAENPPEDKAVAEADRPTTVDAGSRGPEIPEKVALALPRQSPPVERDYLRALIGRQSKPAAPDDSGGAKAAKSKDQQVGDYFVQLATFHVLPNRRV